MTLRGNFRFVLSFNVGIGPLTKLYLLFAVLGMYTHGVFFLLCDRDSRIFQQFKIKWQRTNIMCISVTADRT